MKNKEFEKINACDICGSKSYTQFLTTPDRNYKTGKFTYVKCNNCSLVWLTPRPAKKSLQKFYPDVYRPYHTHKQPNRLQRYIRDLIKNYNFIARLLIYDQLFFWEKKGRILDVGPGSGYYLHILKSWGWYVTGLELDSRAVKLAEKSGVDKIMQGDIYSVKFKPNYFDAIRYSHVLEHVPSPSREIIEARKLLKKGGKIIIIIPNIDSLLFQLFKSYWYPLEAPRHFYQFSPKTLKKLLKINKFKVVNIRYHQPPHTFLWSLVYLLGLHSIDRRIGIFAYPIMFLLVPLALLKRSDVIEIVARK